MVSDDDLTPEQRRAVDALDRNVTLTAGAGTGKTTTLTARYLRTFEAALDDGAADGEGRESDRLGPENVLTTTFTERAANELERSIRTEIADRVASLDVDEYEEWRRVADELEDGYVHTLHGFCARLLRENALTIDQVEPGFDTLDENETAALVDDTVRTVLETHETHEATRTLARQFSRGQLHDVLTDLLGERPDSLEWADRWVDATAEEYVAFVESELHPIDPDEAAERLADPAVVDAVRTLTGMVADPPDIDTGGRAWERAVDVVDIVGDGFDDGVPSRSKQTTVAALGRLLTTGAGERYASYDGAKTNWDGHPRKAAFDDAMAALVERIEPERHDVTVDPEREARSFEFVRALAELTRIAAEEYEARKDRRNAVDFSDLISYTVDFLGSPDQAARRAELRNQFEYVMIDEAQDTDPRQWDLVELLTDDRTGPFGTENVFVVGDAKQSIYRFRNADVTEFRETTRRLANGSGPSTEDGGDQLTTNFRTLPVVLGVINGLFQSVLDVGGAPYEAAPQSLTPDRADPDGVGSVEYLAVPTDPALREERFAHYEEFATAEPDHDAELEAMALAARLSQVLAEPYQVYPEDDSGTDDSDDGDASEPTARDIEPSDVAVLIRSRTHLKTYERALDDRGIPYSVASGVGFYESPEVTALLNLFRALADPTDERALYAVLRSPVFGLADDTLARPALRDGSLWDALADSTVDELERAHGRLAEWRAAAGVTDGEPSGVAASWAALLTRIVEETGFLAAVSGGERSGQAMANVEKLRDQLRDWSDDGVRSLPALVNRIERRIDLGGRESEAETTDEGVQILTIHDAKGMEFPFVVVPGVGRGFNDEAALGSGQVEFERVGETHAVGLKTPSATDPFEMEDTIARDALRERRRAEERAEEKRVLYVACTRARDHLLLCGRHDPAGEADGPTMTDIEEADPDDPSSWRDLVQPELLIGEVRGRLDESDRVQREYGDGRYTVSVPSPPAEWTHDVDDTDPVVELSTGPDRSGVRFRLSATDLAALFGGYGELRMDEDTGVAFVEELVEETPEVQHGDASSTDRAATGDGQESSGEERPGLDPAVFGEVVHRLCELRPPRSEWESVIAQTLADEGVETSLSSAVRDRVDSHARRAIDYVDELVADATVRAQYDELYVTAAFGRGEISGYVDHLIVTPEAYHVVDYKTGDVEADDLAEDADYYATQMKAYAVALAQQGTRRDVRVSLCFTAVDEAWEVTWTEREVAAMEREIRSRIRDGLPDDDG